MDIADAVFVVARLALAAAGALFVLYLLLITFLTLAAKWVGR